MVWWFNLLVVTGVLLEGKQRVTVSYIKKDKYFFPQGVHRNLCHVLILASGFISVTTAVPVFYCLVYCLFCLKAVFVIHFV